MQRVTDDMVRSFLVWGRNYGEIERFERLPGGGRCWRVVLPASVRSHGKDTDLLGVFADAPERIVPTEFVLTSREALAFGYGLAAAGITMSRAEFAAQNWGWETEEA